MEVNREVRCDQYQLTRVMERDNSYVLLEHWRSLAALDTHFKTEHGKRLFGELDLMLAQQFAIKVLEPVLS